MAKLNVYSLKGRKLPKEKVELPRVFETKLRQDIIKRAVIASQSARYQPQSVDWFAGKKTSAASLGAGHALARLPRVKGSRYSASGRGAIAPQAVGGRSAHPPTGASRIKKINIKERRRALASAIAATASKELVEKRGHVIEGVPQIPLIVTDELEKVGSTSETREALMKLGLWGDVERAKEKKIRAGRGKMRGRKYKRKKSILIVVNEDKGISLGARNHPGVDVVAVDSLGVEDLAPGTHPGRLTLYTKSAIERMEEKFQVI